MIIVDDDNNREPTKTEKLNSLMAFKMSTNCSFLEDTKSGMFSASPGKIAQLALCGSSSFSCATRLSMIIKSKIHRELLLVSSLFAYFNSQAQIDHTLAYLLCQRSKLLVLICDVSVSSRHLPTLSGLLHCVERENRKTQHLLLPFMFLREVVLYSLGIV